MKETFACVLVVATLSLGVPVDAEEAASSTLLITGVSVVDSAAGSAGKPQDILVTGGVITEVAAAGTIARERAARVLPAEGRFALSGLIDVHAHVGDGGLAEQSEADRIGALGQFVRYGVTTIFVPGGGGGNDDDLVRWKRRCAAGEVLCPGIYGSGALITAPGSHPISTIWELPADADPKLVYEKGAVAVGEGEDVEPLFEFKTARGVDAIKIVIEDWDPAQPTPRLSTDTITRLSRAAHARGLAIYAHVSSAQHIQDAFAGGADGVMHSAEDRIPDSTLSQMAERGFFYVATLSLYDGFIDRALGRIGSEHEPFARAGAAPSALASLADFRPSPFSSKGAGEVLSRLQDNLRRASRAGVPLALGTDVNNPSVFPGYSAHEELELLVEAGLSPVQALTAATTGSAAFLGREDTLGRIAPGYEADILILSANPLEDILATRSIQAVVADGEVIADVVSARSVEELDAESEPRSAGRSE